MTGYIWSRTKALFRGSDEGAAMAEFAIAFPLQLFITFGIMQLIILYVSSLMVNFAAYRACRAELVGEDGRTAAQVVLAPLAGSSMENADRLEAELHKITVPGWGELHNSEYSWAKTMVYEAGTGDATDLVVAVEFDQELYFPVVDTLMALIFYHGNDNDDTMAFGRAGDTFSADYLTRDSAYDPATMKLKGDKGRMRKIGGAWHYIIARQSTLYRQHAANFKTGAGYIDTGGTP